MFELTKRKDVRSFLPALTLAATCILSMGMTGCSGLNQTLPSASPGAAFQGKVYGGQQPIVGASIYLYAVNTSNLGGPSTNLLTTSVTTNSSGNFNITGDWSCTAGTLVYLVAVGGNPQVGGGTNSNAANMAGLGNCSNLNSSSFITMNEVTTVASAFALQPFMSAYDHVGADTAGQAGLTKAFNNIAKLASVSSGQATTTLGSGGVAPSAKVYALANTLSACINSGGGTAGDGSSCGTLFSAATPSNGTAPKDTIMAAANIAAAPYSNVATLYALAPTTPPFPSQLSAQPTDWAMAVRYSGFNSPKSPAVDSNGNVWVANSGGNTIMEIPQAGTSAISTYSGNGLNAPSGVVIDQSGNVWVSNSGATSSGTVSAFTSSGGALSGSPFSPSGLSSPSAIGIDSSGYIWVGGGTNLVQLSSSGIEQFLVSTGVSNPTAIVYNPY